MKTPLVCTVNANQVSPHHFVFTDPFPCVPCPSSGHCSHCTDEEALPTSLTHIATDSSFLKEFTLSQPSVSQCLGNFLTFWRIYACFN